MLCAYKKLQNVLISSLRRGTLKRRQANREFCHNCLERVSFVRLTDIKLRN